MVSKRKKSFNPVLQSLELIGRPLYLLSIFIFTLIYSLGLLTSEVIHSIKVPKLSLPKTKFPFPNHKFIITVLVCLTVSSLFYWQILRDLPSPQLLTDNLPSLTTKIYDRHGTLLYQIYKNENRSLIKLSDLPKYVIDATITAEDKNFYHHFGFDFIGLVRALYNNFVHCSLSPSPCTLEGGSTITQQLIKNVLLNHEKTLTRKIKELILSIATETVYTKDQILEMYFNQVPYGGTAYGIEEASQAYFGIHAKDLSLAESALLAGLPVSPTTLSPYGVSPYLAIARQHQILEQMGEMRLISEEDLATAKNEPIVLNPQGISILAPHFVMYVKDILVKQYGEDMVSRGGLTVKTTLDLNTQTILQTEINTELAHLAKLNVGNAAGLVINPQSGDILAMVGSRNFYDKSTDGQVNITLQSRQPGSAIKPITYTLALMNGLSPSSTIDDSPICFRIQGQPNYCPSNYDGKFHGTVTLRTALASSYNVPAIKLLNSLGINNLINLARSLGITTWNDSSRFGLSLTLGGGEITMLDLAQVYSVYATGGYKVPLNPIISVTDSTGQDLYTNSSPKQQIIPESIAYQINSILSDNAARSPAFGINSVLNIRDKNVAVKTGTTNALRDNWTFGYTPNLLVSTWVGNNDNSPMSSVVSGITGASPIWSRTMTKLLNSTQNIPFPKPENLIKAAITCTNPPKYDYFVKGKEPKLDCQKTGMLTETAATSP